MKFRSLSYPRFGADYPKKEYVRANHREGVIERREMRGEFIL